MTLKTGRIPANLRLTLIFVIIITLIVASIGGFSHFQPEGTVESSPSELSIGVHLNATSLSWGQTLSVHIWENNTLPEQNNVTVENRWAISGLQVWTCSPSWPMNLGVMRGHYAAGNVSEGQQLQLLDFLTCPISTSLIKVRSFLFEPYSTVTSETTNFGVYSVPLRETVLVSGLEMTLAVCGVPSASCPSEYSGQYTVVVGDEWGHLVFAYFSLSTGNRTGVQ